MALNYAWVPFSGIPIGISSGSSDPGPPPPQIELLPFLRSTLCMSGHFFFLMQQGLPQQDEE